MTDTAINDAPTIDASEPAEILYDVSDHIATITLNRPAQLNAWTGSMTPLYFDLLDAAADDPDVRVIVVTGAGRGFCAGADMNYLQSLDEGDDDTPAETRPTLYATTIPKPVIGAINGAVAGMGFSHAMLCDIRFAAAGAKFTTAFSRRGLVAEQGVSWVLPRLVGQSVAMDLLFSGRVFLAEEAAELGLVKQVVAADDLMSTVRDYATMLVENAAPSSLAMMKRQIWTHLDYGFAQALDESNTLLARSLLRSDFTEGVASYVEKRPPAFAPLTRADVPHL